MFRVLQNAIFCFCSRIALGVLCLCFTLDRTKASDFSAPTPTPSSRVVTIEDPLATDAFRARPDRIQVMVNAGITNLTKTGDVKSAWLSLVSVRDTVGIKVFSAPGPNSGTRPSV